ncbi:MAG: PIN domain-containing protein [Patescibacteria group bacterium]|jgi:tRNA(fMet)-specific endonuclease VapC
MILLDTDVCVELLRGNQQVILKRAADHDAVAISFITAGELFYGAHKSNFVAHNLLQIEKFLLTVTVIQSSVDIMQKFGEQKAKLWKSNILLPDADIMIAATALTKCDKLITGNIQHYQRFNELRIENWIR